MLVHFKYSHHFFNQNQDIREIIHEFNINKLVRANSEEGLKKKKKLAWFVASRGSSVREFFLLKPLNT